MLRQSFSACLGIALIFVSVDSQAQRKKKKKEKAPEKKECVAELELFKPSALKEAIQYLSRRYRSQYSNGNDFFKQAVEIERHFPELKKRLQNGGSISDKSEFQKILDFRKKALVLENPELKFDEIVLVKRKLNNDSKFSYGFPTNFQGNNHFRAESFENEIAKTNLKAKTLNFETLYKPKEKVWVGDLDLHWDLGKMLFSSQSLTDKTWQVLETDITGENVRQLTPGSESDVDNYDAVYLPDGRIIYSSTACYSGVPCVRGKTYVANFHLMNADGSNNRRITFDQENDWYPVMKNDGMVMYLRWEYTDSAHYFSRVLMQMNPDGSGQRSMYGSNSYWPNTMFFARPIPNSNSKFVAIVSGHHGARREGEIIIFDTKKGTTETEGVVQRIGGLSKDVKGEIIDRYADNIWPKYVHPYPVSDKFFLASGRESEADILHSLYLIDTFGNSIKLASDSEHSLLEPMSFVKRQRPPVIPDRIKPDAKEGTIYVSDIYQGPGLKGVPKGTVKKIRIFEYEYAFRNTGGHYSIGMEGCWDVRRILGEANVEEDGSFMVTVPANRPISIQPLDKGGNALQLMRSWLTVMPGETLSCVGCHEDINHAVPTRRNIAGSKAPQRIQPWNGPARGFSFLKEVQPVLDRKCVGCHDGSVKKRPNFAHSGGGSRKFSTSYMNLHPFVRRNGPEGVYHILNAGEFHSSTSRLMQMLKKGHHNVTLTANERNRITTWIDLNVPFHGSWTQTGSVKPKFVERRMALRKKYAQVDVDIETDSQITSLQKVEYIAPEKTSPRKKFNLKVEGWPIKKPATGKSISISLGGNEKIDFVQIPAGKFVMGSENGDNDEYPTSVVAIDKSFYMQTTEITLGQMKQFDKEFKNGFYDMHYKDQVKPGYDMDVDDKLPAIRVPWEKAVAFCQWLSEKSGKKAKLPSEAQWEWAARGGKDSDFYYGDLDTDFSKHANLADISLKLLAVRGVDPKPIKNPNSVMDYELKDARFNDSVLHLAKVGSYKPNAFGLYDMIGNVSEWTRDSYKPYPYSPSSENDEGNKVLRGGAWNNRPAQARASYRIDYPQWMKVFNSGFRVIIEE